MLRVRAFHPLRTGFPARFPSHVFFPRRGPTTPARPRPNRFGLCRFRSPLLAVSLLFSLPQGTKMFQFPWFAPACAGERPSAFRVAPFGYPRIISHLPIPAAFRSLSRPSSPPRAKASAVRPSLLSLAPPYRYGLGLRSVFSTVFSFFPLYPAGVPSRTNPRRGRRTAPAALRPLRQ